MWYYTAISGGPEVNFSQEFEVVAKPYASAPYCSVYDMRAEGLTTQQRSKRSERRDGAEMDRPRVEVC